LASDTSLPISVFNDDAESGIEDACVFGHLVVALIECRLHGAEPKRSSL
jgi:hypothetical protein